jgi:hypothetical protein
MTQSQHFIAGYDWTIRPNLRIKLESYYQRISNAGVDGNRQNSYSVLNQGANFFVASPDTLSNDGTGTNFGLDFTLERFLTNGFYYLLTTSLYDSRYKGSDGVDRNTAFNGNYIVNGLVGKEWVLGKNPEKKQRQQFVLVVDAKATVAGGQRYTPIDPVQVGDNEYVANYDDENAYSQQFDDYFRADLRIAIRQNKKNSSMEFALDIQNLFNVQNIYSQQFNTQTGEVDYNYQLGILIIPQFRINF